VGKEADCVGSLTSGWLSSAVWVEVMEVALGTAAGLGLGSVCVLLRNGELNANLPKLLVAAQLTIVGGGDQKL
jgi:hypothetical protein